MKLRKPLLAGIGAIAATALLAATALPASAGPTDTTLTLTAAGGLTVSVQATAALSGATGDVTVSGNLGDVTVSDLRGSTQGWVASAKSGAFTGTGGTSTAVSYVRGTTTVTGTTNVVDDDTSVTLSAVDGPVATATTSGNNTATWNPVLTVTMPSGALVGTYTGTVTTSVV